MKIPIYDRQVREVTPEVQSVPTPGTNRAAFGEQVFQANQSIAKGIGDIGQVLAKHAESQQELQNNAFVADISNKYDLELQDRTNNNETETVDIDGQKVERPKGFFARQGLNAKGSVLEMDEWQRKTASKYLDSIKDPGLKLKVAQNIGSSFKSSRDNLFRHEAKEVRDGYKNSLESRRDLKIADVSSIFDKNGLDESITNIAVLQDQINKANGYDEATSLLQLRDQVSKFATNAVGASLKVDPSGNAARVVLSNFKGKIDENEAIKIDDHINKEVKANSSILMDDLNSKFIDGTVTLEDINSANKPKEQGGIGSSAARKMMKDLIGVQAEQLTTIATDSEKADKYIKAIDGFLMNTQDNFKAKQILVDFYADGTLDQAEAQKLNRIRSIVTKQKFNRDHPALTNVGVIKSWFGANDNDSRELATTLQNYMTALDEGKKPEEAREELLKNKHNSLYPEAPLGEDDKVNDPTRERLLMFSSFLSQKKNIESRTIKNILGGAVGGFESLAQGLQLMSQRGDHKNYSPFMAVMSQKLDDGKSVGEHVGAAIERVSKEVREELTPEKPNFGDELMQAFGSTGSVFVPSLGLVKGLQVANLAPVVARWFGIPLMSSIESLQNAGQAWKEAVERGVPAKEAGDIGSSVFWSNLPVTTVESRFGLLGDAGPWLKRAFMSGPATGGPSELVQMIFQNIVANDPLFKGGDKAYTIGSIIGSGMSVLSQDAVKELKSIDEGKAILDDLKKKLSNEKGSVNNADINSNEDTIEIKTMPEQTAMVNETQGQYKIEESDKNKETRIKDGYETIIEVDAKSLKEAIEKRGQPIDWSPKRLAEASSRETTDAYPLVFVKEDGSVDIQDGGHRIAAAALEGQTIKVATKGDLLEQYSNKKGESESLYHETGTADLVNAVSDASGLNVSSEPYLALGQSGKGVVFEFDKKKLLTDRGSLRAIKKPGKDFVGQKEFEMVGGQINPESLKSVTIKNGTKLSSLDNAKLKNKVLHGEFKKETLPNGDIKYTNVKHSKSKNILNNDRGSAINPVDAISAVADSMVESKIVKDFSAFSDAALTPLTTRLARVDESLRDRMRKFEFGLGMNKNKDIQRALPFMQGMEKISDADASSLDIALKNSDVETIHEIVDRNGLRGAYEQTRGLLNDLYNRAKEAGLDVRWLDTYFPRRVNDPDAFLSYLRNSENWSAIDKSIKAEEARVGARLNSEERVEFINKLLRGYGDSQIKIQKPSNLKARKIQQIDEQMNIFYKNSAVTLQEYIVAMNNAIEAKKFFGFDNKNAEDSIGAYVGDLVDKGLINQSQEREVKAIVEARFKNRGTHGFWSFYKNLGYLYTMTSPISTLTQIGDLSFSLYENGFYNTVVGLQKSLSKEKITKQDLGIDSIIDEFSDQTKSGKLVNNIFKVISFKAMDNVGKETLINGAMNNLSNKANKNDSELLAEVERVFEEESSQVIKDLKVKEPSENVKYLLFSRLLKYQPITISEMPEHYAKGGNGRIWYMLKSYTIKQLDVYHNEVFRQMKTDPKKAIGNLLKLSLALATMNAGADVIKDVLLGRPIKLSDLAVDNILRLIGFSKYTIYKAKREGLGDALFSTIAPPFPFIGDLYKDLSKKNPPDIADMKIWNALPIIGKFYYWWFGGGREYLDNQNKKIKRIKPRKI